MRDILITGGLGHIGSLLIRKFLFHRLTVVDNLLTQRYSSLFNLPNLLNFYDISFTDIPDNILENTETVIHLAAITDAASSFDNTKLVYKTNVEDTTEFIQRCINCGVKLIIFPSSTSVYGVAEDTVYEDNDKYINPQSPYAESKLAVEEFIKTKLKNNNDTNYLVFRFGSIVGISHGMRFHTAINKFCYEVSIGRPITVWKDNLDKTRPYLGINDCHNVIKYGINNTEMWNNTYNVVTDNLDLNTVIKLINKYKRIKNINYVDTPLLNQYSYNVDSSKLCNTGFKYRDSIEDLILKTVSLLYNAGLNK